MTKFGAKLDSKSFICGGIETLIPFFHLGEGSYLPSNRNSPKSERVENAPLAILIATEQF